MQKKKLYILSDQYPYGFGEDTFIIPEIEVLREAFDITLISAASKNMVMQHRLPKQFEEIKILRYCPWEENSLLFFKYFLLFWIRKDCLAEAKDIICTRRKVLLRIWKSMFFYANAESLYRWIKKNDVIDQTEGIYYSYWYNDRVLAMTMHRDEYPALRIMARAHGYDLFDERVKGTLRQPFKKIMDSQIDHIMFVSNYNLNYYTKKVGTVNSKKYSVQRIGAPEADKFPEIIDRRKIFRLVSCSSLIKLKRIPLIIDALKSIEDIKIEWIHFGSGSDAKEVEKYAQNSLQDNIQFHFKGYVPRDEIYNYYASSFVHCFINVSETEGSPVSIQEALAFGIPVIATDVGGVSEMIDGNGYLLAADPSAEVVAESIRKIYSMSEMEYNTLREKSLTIWRREYDLNKNMSSLLKVFE